MVTAVSLGVLVTQLCLTVCDPMDCSPPGSSVLGISQARICTYIYMHIFVCVYIITLSFPGGSDGKGSACNVEDLGLIPGSEKSLGEGNGYPLQYSFLENSMDREAWWATVHGVTKSQTRLSN